MALSVSGHRAGPGSQETPLGRGGPSREAALNGTGRWAGLDGRGLLWGTDGDGERAVWAESCRPAPHFGSVIFSGGREAAERLRLLARA